MGLAYEMDGWMDAGCRQVALDGRERRPSRERSGRRLAVVQLTQRVT